MKTPRQIFLGLQGVAFVVVLGMMSANCGGSKGNPTPGNKAGSGGGAGASGSGGNAGGNGAAGTAPTDAGAGGAGGAAACDAGAATDAGCMACATDPLLGCPSQATTCIHFTGTVPDVPRL